MTGSASPIILTLDETASTNDAARDALRATGRAHWVTAALQRSGRGRRGRAWSSPRGNLYASYAFFSTLEPKADAFVPLAASVALADAIEAAFAIQTELKWPNDVLVHGLKTAGILVEGENIKARRALVLGFGVNVATAPEGATYLAARCADATPQALLPHLTQALACVLDRLAAADGVAMLRERWLARAVGLGKWVTVRFETFSQEGSFVGLDTAGRLILADVSGQHRLISAGDVFVRETP